MLIGAHVSPAGGLPKAIERGLERDCRAIQIFNQSPRMWRPTVYREEDVAAFREAMASSQIDAVLIHAVYLLNCASEDPEIREKSLVSLTHSLRVGHDIGAAGVVLHPGSAKTGDAAEAVARAGETIREALADSEGCPLHLENTAGAGGTLGRSIDELAALLEAAGDDERLGLCLDSCHLFASGYDIRTYAGMDELTKEIAEKIGLAARGLAAPQRLPDPARVQPRPAREHRSGRAGRERLCGVSLRAPVSGAAVRVGDTRREPLGTDARGDPACRGAARAGCARAQEEEAVRRPKRQRVPAVPRWQR